MRTAEAVGNLQPGRALAVRVHNRVIDDFIYEGSQDLAPILWPARRNRAL